MFYTMIVIARSLRRKRTDILYEQYVGESAQDVGETNGYHFFFSFHLVQMKRLGFFSVIHVFLCRHDLTLGIHPSKHDSFLQLRTTQVIIYICKIG